MRCIETVARGKVRRFCPLTRTTVLSGQKCMGCIGDGLSDGEIAYEALMGEIQKGAELYDGVGD